MSLLPHPQPRNKWRGRGSKRAARVALPKGRGDYAILQHLKQPFFVRAAIPDKIDGMPLTDVLLVNIKLLTLQELKLITDRGAEGRRKLNDLFGGPDRLVSSLLRPSTV